MTKRLIGIETRDGRAGASIFTVEGDTAPGVILYMDAFGPRPALDSMAARLSAAGYVST